MKRYIAWIAGHTLAGVCLIGLGCSGGDVPDPEADSRAASDSAPGGVPPGPAAPPAGPGAARAEEPASPPGQAKAPAAAPAEPPQTVAEPTSKADPASASATSEMLAIATAPPAGDPGAAPAPGATTPPGAGMPGAPGAGMMPGSNPGMMPGSNPGMMPGSGPGMMRGSGPGMMAGAGMNPPPGPGAAMPGALAGAPGMPGGFPGAGANPNFGRGAGMPGSPGGGVLGGSGKPADFTTPLKAVNAFLDALKQRDADLLAESTALRAATESNVKNRKLFTAILEHSLDDDTFDDLIEKLDGFTPKFLNTARSTGRQGVVLEKTVKRHTYWRTIDVRREKAGWKVVDVGGERDLASSTSGVRSKPRQKK